MANECWLFRRKAAHFHFARHVQKSIDLVRRVRSTVEAVILLLATGLSSFNSNWSWLTFFLGYNRYPYQEKTINTWFPKKLPSEDGQEQKAVDVMNVDQEGIRNDVYRTQRKKAFPESLSSDKQFKVFFHGTNHQGAQNIIEDGIDLGKLRKDRVQDFSEGEGYYVCNTFEDAFEWAQRNFLPSEGQAVLVYRVNKKELRGENKEKGLNLRKNKTEWLRVVKEYRKLISSRGRSARNRCTPDAKLRKDLNNWSYIKGPITAGGNNPPSTDFDNSRGKYQLCVRKDNCAQLFDNSLHSVVFFKCDRE